MKICRNNWNTTHFISVGAREDFLVNGEQLLALDIRSSSSSLLKNWRNYEVPVTEVRVIPSSDASPPHQCISDNSILTFDSLSYSHKHQGTYVLYRHKVLPYEVQVFYRRCNLRELCHCSVAVRVEDMIVTFDICSRGYMQVRNIFVLPNIFVHVVTCRFGSREEMETFWTKIIFQMGLNYSAWMKDDLMRYVRNAVVK